MDIQVALAVERARVVAGMVEVWGWVGDYEVMVCLPLNSVAGQAALKAAEAVEV